MKGLKIKDEFETANSDKSGDELETADSVRMFDSEAPNQLKANQRKGSRRGTNTTTARELGKPARANKSIERVEARGIERVDKRERGGVLRFKLYIGQIGCTSREPDWFGSIG